MAPATGGDHNDRRRHRPWAGCDDEHEEGCPMVAAEVRTLEVTVYDVPTDAPESDGTFEWNATTMVLVEATAEGQRGLGYSYADRSCALLVRGVLAPLVVGHDALDIPGAWARMVARVRNLGRPGAASMAISAIDAALWDLKARLLGLPLGRLLGRVRQAVPVYGSG